MKKNFPAAVRVLFLMCVCADVAHGQGHLRNETGRLLNTVKADVGVAIKNLESGDTLAFNSKKHFPMQSVYKFHLALAVLDQVDKGKFSVDQKIFIRKEDFFPDTWSPIAEKYPQGNVELSIGELLSYTVSQSDNNGCDILFRLVGGPKKVDAYIKTLGVKGVAIVNTEQEMHKSWNMQFENWSEPFAMVQLLDLFYQKKILSPASRSLLLDIMEKTVTGRNRIKGLLPEGTVVAHKTGMGSRNDKGILGALNDVGIVTLPNGTHVAIAVFISNAKDDADKLEELIAKISKIAFDHYLQKKE